MKGVKASGALKRKSASGTAVRISPVLNVVTEKNIREESIRLMAMLRAKKACASSQE